jgi:hypothetical protein
MPRRTSICPTCHRPFAPRLIVSGPVRQRLVNLVAERPDGITRAELINAIYSSDPGGGPDWPNVISVLVKLANTQLASQGYRIAPAWRGRGARYRLVRL